MLVGSFAIDGVAVGTITERGAFGLDCLHENLPHGVVDAKPSSSRDFRAYLRGMDPCVMENFRRVEVSDASNFFLIEKSGFHGSMEGAKPSDPIVGFNGEGIGSEAFGAEEFCALLGGP